MGRVGKPIQRAKTVHKSASDETHLDALHRRLTWLRKRSTREPGKFTDDMRAEYAALKWALPLLEDPTSPRGWKP